MSTEDRGNVGWLGISHDQIAHKLSEIDRDTDQLLRENAESREQIATLVKNQSTLARELVLLQKGIDQILDYLTPSTNPVGFTITEQAIQGDNTMTIARAGADLQILDSGKGVLYTLTPVNRSGSPEPLPAGTVVTASSSAPASLANAVPDPGDPTATPPRPADTTGLVFLATVPQPPVDAVGIVMTFSAPFGSTPADPVDVTADNSPAGFTITETAA